MKEWIESSGKLEEKGRGRKREKKRVERLKKNRGEIKIKKNTKRLQRYDILNMILNESLFNCAGKFC